MGNEACADGAVRAGCRFYAGYPITPSSEITEFLSHKLPRVGGVCMQMEDEIASMAACIGASLAGLKAMTSTSGPGFSLKQENIGFAIVVESPVVIVDCQRLGPSTGQPTATSQGDIMQARWGTHGDHSIIALAPASAQDMYDMTIQAFNLAEHYRTPVILLSDAVVAHIREKVIISEDVKIVEREVPDFALPGYQPFKADAECMSHPVDFGLGFRLNRTGLLHDERGFFSARPEVMESNIVNLVNKIEKHKYEIIEYTMDGPEDAELMFISYGITSRAATFASNQLRREGRRIANLILKTVWPFPDERIRELARKIKKMVVPEMNLGMLILEVERAVRGEAEVFGVQQADGQLITPHRILETVKEVLR